MKIVVTADVVGNQYRRKDPGRAHVSRVPFLREFDASPICAVDKMLFGDEIQKPRQGSNALQLWCLDWLELGKGHRLRDIVVLHDDIHSHFDLSGVGLDTDKVRHHPCTLFQFDERDHIGHLRSE